MEDQLDKNGFYLEPKKAGHCPICDWVVIEHRLGGSRYCTNPNCKYATS